MLLLGEDSGPLYKIWTQRPPENVLKGGKKGNIVSLCKSGTWKDRMKVTKDEKEKGNPLTFTGVDCGVSCLRGQTAHFWFLCRSGWSHSPVPAHVM